MNETPDEIGALLVGVMMGLICFVAPTLFIWWRNDKKITFTQAYQRYVAYVFMAMGALTLIFEAVLLGVTLLYLAKFHAMPHKLTDLVSTVIFLTAFGGLPFILASASGEKP